jgi:hypothetical protein
LTFEVQRQLLREKEVLGGQARLGPRPSPAKSRTSTTSSSIVRGITDGRR